MFASDIKIMSTEKMDFVYNGEHAFEFRAEQRILV